MPDLSVNPGGREAPPGAENIGRLLLRAVRAFEVDLTARLAARGYANIRLAHSAVFAHLDREGSRVVDLAERAGMTKQSMAELVDDLVAKGYLERRPDQSDRRAKLIVATTRGRRLLRDAIAEIGRMEAAYQGRLGNDEVDSLRSMLAELAVPQDSAPGG
jgi:DNA-binding MarR family transcriptional regulator